MNADTRQHEIWRHQRMCIRILHPIADELLCNAVADPGGGWGDASPPPAVRHIGIFVGDV